MIHSIPRESIVETLLNSLEAERYVRGPLLRSVIDELSSMDRCTPAAEFARRVLESYEGGRVDDQDFVAHVKALRGLVRTSRERIPASSARLSSEALARADARRGEPSGLLGAA